MKSKNILRFTALLVLFEFFLWTSDTPRLFAQNIYANKITDSSADFVNAYKAADTNRSNYAYLSNILSLLSTSYLTASFPAQGIAGDVINIQIQSGTGVLSAALLNDVTVKLYDSLGNNVTTVTGGSSLLQLSLLSPGSNIYAIRLLTNPIDNYKFKSARVEFNNVLTLNLLSQFRVYNIFYQQPCPAVLANTVYAYGSSTSPSLLSGYVLNPSNAVDNDQTTFATLNVNLDLLSLFPPAYLDLHFSQYGRSGDYVGFTVAAGSSLLSLSVLQNITITVYDEFGTSIATSPAFTVADLRLLSGSSNKYTIGFVTPAGNHNIARAKISMSGAVSLLENIEVFNAYHYRIDATPITITTSGPTTFCAGGSVTLTAFDSLGANNFVWNTGAMTPSITVNTSGTYSVSVTDTEGCTRYSVQIQTIAVPPLHPVITGDTVLCAAATGVLQTAIPYSKYLWSDGDTTSTTSITTAGQYYVRVTDSNSCTAMDTVIVQKNNLNVTPTIVANTCSDNSNGSISLAVTGGSGSYSYLWSNGTAGSSLGSLHTGIYTNIITDNVYHCTYNTAFTVPAGNTLSVRSSVVNTSTCGAADGAITVQGEGGNGNYTYTWNTGATTATINNLQAGIYIVNVKDNASLCQTADTFVVSDGGSTLAIVPAVINATSCATANGAVTLVVTGGTGSYSYLWSNGAVTSSLTNLAPGNYYVLVKDNTTHCSKGATITISNSAALQVSGITTATACNGKTGIIIPTVLGGSGIYTYRWNTGATTASINTLPAGTYILAVTDNLKGCTQQKVFTVGETGGPAVTLSTVNAGCTSSTNGSIALTTTDTHAKYIWSNAATTGSLTSLAPGTYVVKVTDTVTGCITVDTANIGLKPQISLTANVTSNTSCVGNGAIFVNATGGLPPYQYVWSTGAITANITNAVSGNYIVSVTDGNACNDSLSAAVTTDTNLVLKVVLDSFSAAKCIGSASGIAVVHATGGQLPYTYHWSSGALTAILTNAVPGNYTVTVTDANGCNATTSVNILADTTNGVHITDSVAGASCNGAANGSVYVNVSGGTMPYLYSWSNGAGTLDLLNVLPAAYTLTVTDVHGCGAIALVTIPVDTAKAIHILTDTVFETSCNSAANGGIMVTVSGGTAPYQYHWSNGTQLPTLLGVVAGAYSLTVTDASGCSATISVNIPVDPTKDIHIVTDTVVETSCNGAANGGATVTVSGGTAPYQYSWSNGTQVPALLGVTAGTYTVTVTDASGCHAVDSINIPVDPTKGIHIVTDSVIETSCNSAANGGATVTVSGGTAPYQYSWSNGTHVADLLGVVAGTYAVTVTDASGCHAADSINIPVDPTKAIHIVTDSVIETSCNSAVNGGATVTVSGGTAPYQYSWSNGTHVPDLLGVIAGTYTVTVTDASGCHAADSINIPVDPTKDIHINTDSITKATCNAAADGSIYLDVSGGTAPYQYSWSSGAHTENLLNVIPASYTVTVTDASGCNANASISIPVDTADAIHVTADSTIAASCSVAANGSIYVNVSGGTTPYQYSWSNGTHTENLLNATPAFYTLTVTDTHGCTGSLSASISINPLLSVQVALDSTVKAGCGNTATGAAYVHAYSGTTPYHYLWSNGSITQDLINVLAGAYTLVVTDAAGCTAGVDAVIASQAQLVVALDVTNITCYGDANGAITANVTAGTGNYGYSWSNGAMSSSINDLGAGSYSVTVTDNGTGCTATGNTTLTVPDSLQINLTTSNITCAGGDGTAVLNVLGGTLPYTYLWSNNGSGDHLGGLIAGNYTVSVTDQNGCSKSASFTLDNMGGCDTTIIVHNVITPNGDGVNDNLIIEGIQNYPNNSLEIFDKVGDLVYEQERYNNNWHGQDKGSNSLPGGTYFYLLKLNAPNLQGGKTDFTGYVMIQR